MALPGRPRLHAVYRTGEDGARVVYPDGTVVQHAPFSEVAFDKMPQSVEGRLYPVPNRPEMGYETK